MRPSLSLALILPFLIVLPVPGQDLQPTLVRAASRIGDRLVETLPDSVESVAALAVVSDGVGRREAKEAIVDA